MNISRRLILMISLTLAVHSHASPEEAQQIRKKWDLAMETWNLEMRSALTPAQRSKALAHKPDLTAYARDMWKQIGDSLDKEWTIEPAAWFLRTAPSLITTQPDGSATLTFTREIEAIRKAVETHHLNSGKLAPMCMAMVTSKDPRSLATLEKIQEKHPDKKIQGVAALAAAIILKTYGDDASVMQRRITYLRKAIIQSVDVDLGGTTVAKLAEDELYIITKLSKGRTAPDLNGTDVAGRPLKLSDFKGKVVMLVFWNSSMDNADQVIRMMTETETKMRGKPFVLLGINNDPAEKLRKLAADDTVTFKNFSDPANQLAAVYRVGSWPLAYVLDGDRKIQYAGTPGSFAELTAEALLSTQKSSEGK